MWRTVKRNILFGRIKNSMNYQFTSNQNLEYRTNMTNDFVVIVEPSTDARDSNTYILVNEMFYPTTLSNVNKTNKNDFYFQLTFEVKNFVKDEFGFLLPTAVNFEFDKVMIPQGFYDAEICLVLNKHLSQFGLNFFVEDSKTMSVSFNMFFEYWFLPTQNLADRHAIDHKLLDQFRKVGQSVYGNYPVYDVKVELTLGHPLAFILGLDITEFVFKQQLSTVIKGSHVVDNSAGLSFMFLECDKIENVIVGFEQ